MRWWDEAGGAPGVKEKVTWGTGPQWVAHSPCTEVTEMLRGVYLLFLI